MAAVERSWRDKQQQEAREKAAARVGKSKAMRRLNDRRQKMASNPKTVEEFKLQLKYSNRDKKKSELMSTVDPYSRAASRSGVAHCTSQSWI